MNVMVAKRH